LRIRHYGYRSRACGENIAYSSGRYGEPDNVMQRWFESRITGKHPERDFARTAQPLYLYFTFMPTRRNH
jgi:hypothetical protein